MLKQSRLFKVVASLLIALFSNLTFFPGYAQASPSFLNLPSPKQFIPLSSTYSLPILKGIKLNPDNPLQIDFIIDTASKDNISKEEAKKLINYFLAGLTIPEEDLWVNLSPYEKDRIIPDNLSQTALGEQLLSQDYILKQLLSSITHPESKTGRDYWQKTYEEIGKIAKSTNIPVDTFNKIWISPDKAQIYEHKTLAIINQATLKAMLEEGLQSAKSIEREMHSAESKGHSGGNKKQSSSRYAPCPMPSAHARSAQRVAHETMKQTILPKITRDINQGKNFASLRQIYHSLILAKWFKEKFKNSFYRHYINQNKLNSIDLSQKGAKDKIYNLYTQAFKKGLYDYVKKENTPPAPSGLRRGPSEQKLRRRRYFSGGYDFTADSFYVNTTPADLKRIITSSAIKGKLVDAKSLFSRALDDSENIGQTNLILEVAEEGKFDIDLSDKAGETLAKQLKEKMDSKVTNEDLSAYSNEVVQIITIAIESGKAISGQDELLKRLLNSSKDNKPIRRAVFEYIIKFNAVELAPTYIQPICRGNTDTLVNFVESVFSYHVGNNLGPEAGQDIELADKYDINMSHSGARFKTLLGYLSGHLDSYNIKIYAGVLKYIDKYHISVEGIKKIENIILADSLASIKEIFSNLKSGNAKQDTHFILDNIFNNFYLGGHYQNFFMYLLNYITAENNKKAALRFLRLVLKLEYPVDSDITGVKQAQSSAIKKKLVDANKMLEDSLESFDAKEGLDEITAVAEIAHEKGNVIISDKAAGMLGGFFNRFVEAEKYLSAAKIIRTANNLDGLYMPDSKEALIKLIEHCLDEGKSGTPESVNSIGYFLDILSYVKVVNGHNNESIDLRSIRGIRQSNEMIPERFMNKIQALLKGTSVEGGFGKELTVLEFMRNLCIEKYLQALFQHIFRKLFSANNNKEASKEFYDITEELEQYHKEHGVSSSIKQAIDEVAVLTGSLQEFIEKKDFDAVKNTLEITAQTDSGRLQDNVDDILRKAFLNISRASHEEAVKLLGAAGEYNITKGNSALLQHLFETMQGRKDLPSLIIIEKYAYKHNIGLSGDFKEATHRLVFSEGVFGALKARIDNNLKGVPRQDFLKILDDLHKYPYLAKYLQMFTTGVVTLLIQGDNTKLIKEDNTEKAQNFIATAKEIEIQEILPENKEDLSSSIEKKDSKGPDAVSEPETMEQAIKSFISLLPQDLDNQRHIKKALLLAKERSTNLPNIEEIFKKNISGFVKTGKTKSAYALVGLADEFDIGVVDPDSNEIFKILITQLGENAEYAPVKEVAVYAAKQGEIIVNNESLSTILTGSIMSAELKEDKSRQDWSQPELILSIITEVNKHFKPQAKKDSKADSLKKTKVVQTVLKMLVAEAKHSEENTITNIRKILKLSDRRGINLPEAGLIFKSGIETRLNSAAYETVDALAGVVSEYNVEMPDCGEVLSKLNNHLKGQHHKKKEDDKILLSIRRNLRYAKKYKVTLDDEESLALILAQDMRQVKLDSVYSDSTVTADDTLKIAAQILPDEVSEEASQSSSLNSEKIGGIKMAGIALEVSADSMPVELEGAGPDFFDNLGVNIIGMSTFSSMAQLASRW